MRPPSPLESRDSGRAPPQTRPAFLRGPRITVVRVLDSGTVAGGCKAERHSSEKLTSCPLVFYPQELSSISQHSVQSLPVHFEVRKGDRFEAEQMRKLFQSTCNGFPQVVWECEAVWVGFCSFGGPVIRTEGHPLERKGLSSIVGLSAPCPVSWSVKVFRNKLRYRGTFF